MKLVHLSDLHLGFRAYGRIDRGADMRERDVAAAFERAVADVVKLAPDAIVISGDVFDRPDPPASAVVVLARGLETFRVSLPDAPVLMVSGPRDTPRRPGDPGALAVLDTFSNVDAATALTRSLRFNRFGLHACLVPHRAVRRDAPPIPGPLPTMQWNVLVLHATPAVGSEDGIPVDPDEWDYVALGGSHRRRELAERVRYPGSLERVALDPWDEAADEKGFLSVDLTSGRTEFHAIHGRPVVALAPVKVREADGERVRGKVQEVMREVPGGIANKIVRLRLQGASPEDVLALQGEPLRDLRAEALHLAIEAGPDLRVPSETWQSLDVPRRVRDAVARELEREGGASGETRTILERVLPDLPPGGEDAPHGAIDALDGELPGWGRVSTSIPAGLTGVLGGTGRARRAVAELYRRVGATGSPGALRRWWEGEAGETLAGALRVAVDAVAESRGVGVIDEAMEMLGVDPPTAEEPPTRSRPARGAVRVDPEIVEVELDVARRDLMTSRADVTEIDGDLEVATMDWHRERQDAETTLFAYRDRARELRGRIRHMETTGPDAPCPTCGRVLETHYREVMAELQDEWEAVVQDGRWWKSRWEQLELKPTHLQELERRSLTLHAALEAGSERVELLRARLEELRGTRTAAPALEGPEGAVLGALLRVRTARMTRVTDLLLNRASRFVSRISGGRILAITTENDFVHLQGTLGPLTPLSEEDLACGRIAIRLAVASLVAARGRVVSSFAIEQPFDRLDAEARLRTLAAAKELAREVPRVVLFSRGDVVETRPEMFDYVLEVREGSPSGPVVRPAPAGPGRVVLTSSAMRPTASLRG